MPKDKPCCVLCSPEGIGLDPLERAREIAADRGWAVQIVLSDNPYEPGFVYTIGLEGRGQPELIAFGHDAEDLGHLMNAVAEKTAARKEWRKRFQVSGPPGPRVQLRPALDVWRDRHATFAAAYWEQQPFRLWQVRLPRGDGSFSHDGRCCTPPCQPLLDLAEPWRPIEHQAAPLTSTALWHRAVAAGGIWTGRWEKLHGIPLGGDLFGVASVPFLADDVALADIVTTAVEPGGRRVITSVEDRSDYVTLRIDGRDAGDREPEVEKALRVLCEHEEVVFECTHLTLPYWVYGVPLDLLSWAEHLLRPLLRDGVVDYRISGTLT